jgi:general stress protein YciG
MPAENQTTAPQQPASQDVDPQQVDGSDRHSDGHDGARKRKSALGHEFYRAIGQKGGKATFQRKGSDHFSRLGQKGGTTTRETHGFSHYSRIGKISRAQASQRDGRTQDNE